MDKRKIQEFFDGVASRRDFWKKKNKYYWNDLVNFYRFNIHDEASVLEIGCGTGDILAGIKAKRKVGIDLSPRMIEIAKKKYPFADWRVADAESLSVDEKFDYIIVSNVLGYFDDIQKILEEIKKICHEHTKIIVAYYNFLWQPALNIGETLGLKMKQPQQNWFSRKDIENLLYLAGYDAFKGGERLLFPKYIPLFSAFLNKYLAKIPFFRKLCLTYYIVAKPAAEEKWQKDRYSVSVIVPARNESGNIENAVRRIPEMGKFTEIIFIEGNSTDDTWEKIGKVYRQYKDKRPIRIGQQEGRGKGDAVRKGFDMASGDILMILDADLTMPPEDLTKFFEAIASGKGEFINGSRLVYNMDKRAMRFLNLLANKFFGLLFSWILDQRFKDTLCGTKVIFKKDYELLKKNRKFFGDFDPFGDFDLIFGASKLNLKIIEMPIRYRERTYGSTNISRFSHGFLLLKMCLFAIKKIKFI